DALNGRSPDAASPPSALCTSEPPAASPGAPVSVFDAASPVDPPSTPVSTPLSTPPSAPAKPSEVIPESDPPSADWVVTVQAATMGSRAPRVGQRSLMGLLLKSRTWESLESG